MGTVEITQRGPDAMIMRWDGFTAAALPEIRERVCRWLSIEWEPSAAIARLSGDLRDEAALLERGGGRMLRCWMAEALVAEPGNGAFPGPDALLDYGEERLRDPAKLGFRAASVVSATRRMLSDGAINASGEGRPDQLSHDYLIGLKGIGPYAAAHCRLLLHDFTRIPVDSGVIAYLREHHGCSPAEYAASRSAWGPYLALGYKLARLREKLEAA